MAVFLYTIGETFYKGYCNFNFLLNGTEGEWIGISSGMKKE
jgi:hypothetical protein